MAFINLGIAELDVIEQIGKGGTSRVYRARQRDLDREVAVKVMNVGDDPDVLRRFDRERRAMGRLSLNSGIVPVYSSGLTGRDEPYLVMPYYPRGSLADRMGQGPLHWREAVDHIVEVARTMAAAHEANVVHLDLKPGNILLASDGSPRIADFGIAKLIGDQTVSRTGGASFTPAYSAPETLLGGEVSAAADVYGLGATLWALLAGQPPFRSETGENSLMAVIGRVVHEPPGDLRHLAPEGVCDVIATAMAKDPHHRHATAGAFSRALLTARTTDDRAATRLNRLGLFPAPTDEVGGSSGDPQHRTEAVAVGPAALDPMAASFGDPFDLRPPVEAVYGFEPVGSDDGQLGATTRPEPLFGRLPSLRFDEPVPPRFVPAVSPSGVDDAVHRYGPAAAFVCSVLVFLGAIVYVAGSQQGDDQPGGGAPVVRAVTEDEMADANADLQDDPSTRDSRSGPAGPSTTDPAAVSGTGSAPSSLSDLLGTDQPEAASEPPPGAASPGNPVPPGPDRPTTQPPASTPTSPTTSGSTRTTPTSASSSSSTATTVGTTTSTTESTTTASTTTSTTDPTTTTVPEPVDDPGGLGGLIGDIIGQP